MIAKRKPRPQRVFTARPTAVRNGGSRAWRALSKRVAKEEPVCWLRFPRCTLRSTCGDHYWPVKYRPDLELIRANLRGACSYCNHARGATLPGDIPKLRAQLEARASKQGTSRALRFFD